MHLLALVLRVAERFAQAVLEVAQRGDATEVHADVDKPLRHRRPDPGEHAARADELHFADQLHQVIGGLGVDDLHAGQIDDHEARLRARHLGREALHHVGHAPRVDDADDRYRQHVVARSGDDLRGARHGGNGATRVIHRRAPTRSAGDTDPGRYRALEVITEPRPTPRPGTCRDR